MKQTARILALFVWASALQAQPFDLVIANGRVMDPESGLDAIRHIGITNGTIEAVSESPLEGHATLDASGRVVAPGFIDLNTYQHGDPFFRLRAADGVTSVLYLEDGAVDVDAYYDALESRALIHHGIAVGHGSLRNVAAGDTSLEIVDGVAESGGSPEVNHRPLSDDELDKLAELVEQGLRAGAVAVGFGIEYAPGATHSEILRMLEVAERYEASAHLHLRKWDKTQDWGQFFEVFGGAIHTGGELHVNHLQSIAGSYTGKCLELIDRARSFGLQVTTECYPYTAGLTFIESALFDNWETRSDLDRFEWPATGERLTRETFARYREQGGVVIIHPRDEAAQEAAVRTCLAHPLPMIASDGAWDDGKTHPRSAGTNSRVLGRYVREEGVLSLMEALRKMSLAPAQQLERRVPAMRRKGRVQVGADADLVVFDPTTVIDRATYSEPTLPPLGIEAVLVNGVPVVRAGAIQDGIFPGRPIRTPVSESGLPQPCEIIEHSAATTDYHGEIIEDRYRWLEDLTSPCTEAWLARRSSESSVFFRRARELRSQTAVMVSELARIKSNTTRVENGFLLTEERSPGSNLPTTFFARPSLTRRILIDPDRLGIDSQSSIRYVLPSPDGTHVAFGLAPAGQRLMSIHVAHVESQSLLSDRIDGVKYAGVSWARKGREFVYTRYRSPGTLSGDTIDRGPVVAVHRLGRRSEDDVILFAGDTSDPTVGVAGELSDDGRLLLVWDWSSQDDGEQVLVADLMDPENPDWRAPLQPTLGRRQGNHRYVGGHGPGLYLQTTLDAPRQRIIRIDAAQPRSWTTVVTEDARPLQHSAFTDRHLVLAYRQDIVTEVEIFNLESRDTVAVDLPAPGSAFAFRRGPSRSSVSFLFDTFTQPPAGYELPVREGRIRPLAAPRNAVEGFVTNQHFATSRDGTRVPFFLVSRPRQSEKAAPTLLYGYGASRAIMEPEFDAEWVTWLRLGGKLAIANIRGGGEYGEAWHAAGSLARKQNSFDDFIAIADKLIVDRHTSAGQLVAYGASNGGLLMGAVMVQRPDLFAAILADVGIYDALRFPLFTAGPRWAGEMGDARKPEQYPWVRSWSPIHNLVEGTCYPATLLTTARDDDLVHPSQSYKFAAALAETQGCQNPILLRAYESGGHDNRNAHGLLAERAADRLVFAAIHTGLRRLDPKSNEPAGTDASPTRRPK